jgi:FkbM family methyltransferase
MTSAMEKDDPIVTSQVISATETSLTNLHLPGGRTTQVEYVVNDLSVGASLVASGGQWEPHVRKYLETRVRPDWICLDISANLGVHTLSLATLVLHGRVIAFEADPSNYELLNRNVRSLKDPKAPTELVQIALWDARGTLTIGGANELAGCSFVSAQGADAGGIEQRLRAVVNPAAIERTDLHLRMAEISALPLDEWISNNPQPRVDLIKRRRCGNKHNPWRRPDITSIPTFTAYRI